MRFHLYMYKDLKLNGQPTIMVRFSPIIDHDEFENERLQKPV